MGTDRHKPSCGISAPQRSSSFHEFSDAFFCQQASDEQKDGITGWEGLLRKRLRINTGTINFGSLWIGP